MNKCSNCVFYNKDGYKDMGFTIPECKLKLILELRKKNNNEKYDLFSSLIGDDLIANKCIYYFSLDEIVDFVLSNITD